MDESGDSAPKYTYNYEDFERAHKPQLLAGDVPQELWEPLFSKLANDASFFFQIPINLLFSF